VNNKANTTTTNTPTPKQQFKTTKVLYRRDLTREDHQTHNQKVIGELNVIVQQRYLDRIDRWGREFPTTEIRLGRGVIRLDLVALRQLQDDIEPAIRFMEQEKARIEEEEDKLRLEREEKRARRMGLGDVKKSVRKTGKTERNRAKDSYQSSDARKAAKRAESQQIRNRMQGKAK
jgi:hypothetical protein